MILPITTPPELFTYGSIEDITQQYKRLALKYHPDKGGTDQEFQLLKTLYDQAVSLIKENQPWDNGTNVVWNNGKYRLNYIWKNQFELGSHYCGENNVLFIINDNHTKLNELAIDTIKKCQDKLSKTTGVVQKTKWMIPILKSQSNSNTLILEKTKAFRPIREIINKYGAFEPAFVAWIIGRLMHLLCFLEFMEIVHGGINIDNLYIDLDNHAIALYGGWWYSVPVNTKYKALPKSSIRFLGSNTISSYLLDRESVRNTALELLGITTPAALRMNTDIPKTVATFLGSPLTNSMNAVMLYKQWETARDAGFGARKFIKFKH